MKPDVRGSVRASRGVDHALGFERRKVRRADLPWYARASSVAYGAGVVWCRLTHSISSVSRLSRHTLNRATSSVDAAVFRISLTRSSNDLRRHRPLGERRECAALLGETGFARRQRPLGFPLGRQVDEGTQNGWFAVPHDTARVEEHGHDRSVRVPELQRVARQPAGLADGRRIACRSAGSE